MDEDEIKRLWKGSRDKDFAEEQSKNESLVALLLDRQSEASLKTVGNLLYHCPQSRKVYGPRILELCPMEMEGERRFALLRSYFLATIELEIARMMSKETVQRLVEFPWDVRSLVEVLRILFNLSRIAPLTCDYHPLIRQCFQSEDQLLIGNAFNLLVNLEYHGDIRPLLGAFERLLVANELDFIPSACRAIIRICKDESRRGEVRKIVLPLHRHDSDEKNKSGDPPTGTDSMTYLVSDADDKRGSALKMLLAGFLSSPHTTVSESVGEMLAVLCKHKPIRLVYHFGYGQIAGYLYSKGLLGQSLQMDDLEDSSDEEDIKNVHFNG